MEQCVRTFMPQFNTKFDRYNHSLKGTARNDRHRQTETYKATLERFYANHGGKATYWNNWYHSVQDEAGCHIHTRDFYPAYRLIESLKNAEIVEI